MLITRAAIMYSNGEIIEGFSYHSIGNLARKLGFSGDQINGFVNSAGDFVLPKEAGVVAIGSSQLPLEYFRDKQTDLSPDDLWPVLQTD